MGLCVCLWGGQHWGKDFEGETWVSLETTDVEQDSGETLGCWEALGSHRISEFFELPEGVTGNFEANNWRFETNNFP